MSKKNLDSSSITNERNNLSQEKVYYTYFLIDPRNKKIFYVGKGKRRRMYAHVRNVNLRIKNNDFENIGNKKKFYKIKKILDSGNKIIYKKLKTNLTEKEALYWEEWLIKYIKIENLTNMTYGGESGIPNEETRRKMSEWQIGRKLTKEHRENISNSVKGERNPFWGKKHTKETIKVLKEVDRSYTKTKEYRENMRKIVTGRKHKEETKKIIIEKNIGKKRSLETRKKYSQWQIGRKLTKEHKENISNSRKGIKFSKEHKNNLSLKSKFSITVYVFKNNKTILHIYKNIRYCFSKCINFIKKNISNKKFIKELKENKFFIKKKNGDIFQFVRKDKLSFEQINIIKEFEKNKISVK